MGRFINADGIVGQTGNILGHNMYAYTENNPVKYVDPTGYQLADPTKDNDGVEPLRPVWSSPYDYYYNDWYVHPKYNDNLYEIYLDSNIYFDYDQKSLFWYYMGITGAGVVTFIGGVICPPSIPANVSLAMTILGGASTVIGGGLVIYDDYGQKNAEVFTMKVYYNERHNITRIDVTYYDIVQMKGKMTQSYKYVDSLTIYTTGVLTEREISIIKDALSSGW